jgi:hypothetical protein
VREMDGRRKEGRGKVRTRDGWGGVGVHHAKSREGNGEERKKERKEGRQSIIREDGKEERSRAGSAENRI